MCVPTQPQAKLLSLINKSGYYDHIGSLIASAKPSQAFSQQYTGTNIHTIICCPSCVQQAKETNQFSCCCCCYSREEKLVLQPRKRVSHIPYIHTYIHGCLFLGKCGEEGCWLAACLHEVTYLWHVWDLRGDQILSPYIFSLLWILLLRLPDAYGSVAFSQQSWCITCVVCVGRRYVHLPDCILKLAIHSQLGGKESQAASQLVLCALYKQWKLEKVGEGEMHSYVLTYVPNC